MRLWGPRQCLESPKEAEAAVSRAHWQGMEVEDPEAGNRDFEVNTVVCIKHNTRKVSCKISNNGLDRSSRQIRFRYRPCLGQKDGHSGDRIRHLRLC